MVRHSSSIEDGFTLMEMLATILVFSVGILTLFQAINAVMYAENSMAKRMLAVSLAREKLEEIKAADSYAAIDNFISERSNMGGAWADFDREVLVSGDPKRVEVVLYWGAANDAQSLHMSTLMADYGF